MKLGVDVIIQVLSFFFFFFFSQSTSYASDWETQFSEVIIQFIFSNNGES